MMPDIASGGWWTLKRKKILESPADLWVMVLYQFHSRKFDFVVIPPQELFARYNRIGVRTEIVQSYICVTKQGRCWETRGLGNADLQSVSGATYRNASRDLTKYLNVWPFSAFHKP
jgi:hypothetical protein